MKATTIINAIVIFLLMSNVLVAQSDCKVKKLGIEKSYEGACKKGLANGEGVAKGVDEYQGSFKKGLPDGIGEYIWANGDIYSGEWSKGLRDGKGEMKMIREGKDSLLTGFWKNDVYIGEFKNSYEIITRTPDIVSVNFSNKGEGNELILMITKGRVPTDVSGLNVTGLYGTGVQVNRSIVFRDIEYPWQGSIRFSYQDQGLKTEELVAKINTPGIWEIRIDLRFTR